MTPQPSHLSESSIAGKKYDYKKECVWCAAMYDADLSDSMKSYLYCSLACQVNDEFLTESFKRSE